MAFKGVLPSDLWLKYNVKGGRYLLELDLLIAAEINDKISDVSTEASKKNAMGAVARRDQRREKRKLLSNNNDLLNILRDSGVPVEGKSRED